MVVIPKGEGVSGIAERLERDEVITDRGMFVTSIIYFMYLRGAGALKAGEYEFRKAASMRQVLDTLVEGKSIAHKVTLAEGLTSQQIVERIQASPDLQGTITEIPAEGTLLPDTYRFQIGDSRQDIIERMQVAQKKFLAKMWEERDPDIVVQTPEEAVILASIVEKETSRADERPLIASVFQNRLRKKMRLQSDPTIIYGLVGGKGVLDHPIQQEELERETAYNTYKINGLPPTPIGNPGRAAIEAVLKPAKTKDLYFVADGTGGHAFAPSLDEHNKNVAQLASDRAGQARAGARRSCGRRGSRGSRVAERRRSEWRCRRCPRQAPSSRRTRSLVVSLRRGSRPRQAAPRQSLPRRRLLPRAGQTPAFRCPSEIRCVEAGLPAPSPLTLRGRLGSKAVPARVLSPELGI